MTWRTQRHGLASALSGARSFGQNAFQLKIFCVLFSVAATAFSSVAADEARPPAAVWTFNAEPWQSRDIRQPEQAREVWDTIHLVAALQGLVNRESPRLYLFYCRQFGVATDRFWFD